MSNSINYLPDVEIMKGNPFLFKDSDDIIMINYINKRCKSLNKVINKMTVVEAIISDNKDLFKRNDMTTVVVVTDEGRVIRIVNDKIHKYTTIGDVIWTIYKTSKIIHGNNPVIILSIKVKCLEGLDINELKEELSNFPLPVKTKVYITDWDN